MLSGTWLVVAVLVAVLLTWWITFTVTRISRLYARTEAAQAAMDAQLVRRAAALVMVADESPDPLDAHSRMLREVSQRALTAPAPWRQAAENDVSRAVAELVGAASGVDGAAGAGGAPAGGPEGAAAQALLASPVGAELHEACVRSAIARRFYNDAARDTRALLSARLPRYLRLARGRQLPQFFDIEDAPPWTPPSEPAHDTAPHAAPHVVVRAEPGPGAQSVPSPEPVRVEANDRA
jgi:hypothetical protein